MLHVSPDLQHYYTNRIISCYSIILNIVKLPPVTGFIICIRLPKLTIVNGTEKLIYYILCNTPSPDNPMK